MLCCDVAWRNNQEACCARAAVLARSTHLPVPTLPPCPSSCLNPVCPTLHTQPHRDTDTNAQDLFADLSDMFGGMGIDPLVSGACPETVRSGACLLTGQE
jgi:hypothetical protein